MTAGARSPGRATRRERELVVEALFLHERPAPRLAELAAEELSWARVLDLARDRAVLGTLACAIFRAGLESRLDPDAREALREAYENAAAQNALLLHELGRIQAALDAAGVASVALKGAALLARHYPALGARHADDIDLLVLPERVEAAARVLDGLGWVAGRQFPMDTRGRAVDPHAIAPTGHHLPMRLGPSGVPCELHVRLPGADPATPVGGLLERAVAVPFGSLELRLAAPADLLAMTCQHVVNGHAAEPRYVLRHVADLHALLATTDVQWGDALRLHPGAGPALDASAAMLAQAGRPGGRGPARARARASELMAERGLRTRWRRLVRQAAKAWRVSPAELGRLVVPTRSYMAVRFGALGTSAALPLLYVYRPLRAAWRLVTGR